MKKVYTIGTNTRSLDEFLRLLDKHSVQRIVDVRRFPTSRLEHFKKENLENLELGYTHIPELGGYRGDYVKYMDTEEFKTGLAKLLRFIEKETCVIVCAELLFFRCHRRFISDALLEKGVKVLHIVDEKRVIPHTHRA